MGHHCDYGYEIKYDARKKQVMFELTAIWRNKHQTVYREWEDGTRLGRGIECTMFAGYVVTFIGMKRVRYYYGTDDIEEGKWQNYGTCRPTNIFPLNDLTKQLDLVSKKDPRLRYFNNKILKTGRVYNNCYEYLSLVKSYRFHPEVEALVEANQFLLATSKTLFKLAAKKKKQVIDFIKLNPNERDMNLSIIFKALKYKITDYKLMASLQEYGYNLSLYNYLNKQKESIGFYRDYENLLDRTGHGNTEDDYWLFPKNLRAAHNQLQEQLRQIEKARLENANKNFRKVAFSIGTNEKVINNYKIYIPSSIDDVSLQAKALNQCLMTCSYWKKMIDQKSVLVFIRDLENKPIGTIEINFDKQILQAYGNEKDRTNCLLDGKLKEIANLYISELKIKKHRLKLLPTSSNQVVMA